MRICPRAAFYEFLKSDRARFKSSSCCLFLGKRGKIFRKKGGIVFGVYLYATIDIRQPVVLKTFFSFSFSKCKFMTISVPFIIRKRMCILYIFGFASLGWGGDGEHGVNLIQWKKRFSMLMKS